MSSSRLKFITQSPPATPAFKAKSESSIQSEKDEKFGQMSSDNSEKSSLLINGVLNEAVTITPSKNRCNINSERIKPYFDFVSSHDLSNEDIKSEIKEKSRLVVCESELSYLEIID